jgi:restriction endonuclease Mrr
MTYSLLFLVVEVIKIPKKYVKDVTESIHIGTKRLFSMGMGNSNNILAKLSKQMKHYFDFNRLFTNKKSNAVCEVVAEEEHQEEGKEQHYIEVEEVEKIEVMEVEHAEKEVAVFNYKVQSKCAQLPEKDSVDYKILESLTALSHESFKQVITGLFSEMKEAKHIINQIGPAGTNGFTFSGQLELGGQFAYAVNFIGEARKENLNHGIDAKHVGRTLSMLNRGQFGFFITTSYFTESAQIDVLKENDSIKIIHGKALVQMFKELNLIQGNQINELWLKRVLKSNQKCA